MPPPGDRQEEGQLLAMEVILSLRCGVKAGSSAPVMFSLCFPRTRSWVAKEV